MSLTNCEVNLILTWSVDCVKIYTNFTNQIPIFTIIETTEDNVKLLHNRLDKNYNIF